MRVAQVVFVLPKLLDGLRGRAVVTAARVEILLDLREHIRRHLIAAALCELVHQIRDQLVVVIRREEQQALEVGRDQDIHRGRSRGVEITVFVVGAALFEKVGQHVVAVGGADELVHRQAHLTRDVRGQDVAEVAGRDADVDLVPHFDCAALYHIAVRGNIVRDLRRKAAPVDGIG